MTGLLRWLSEHKFQAYFLVFCLISLPPVALFFTAQSAAWVTALLAVVVLGNLLAVLIR
jgi:hypothetical protein